METKTDPETVEPGVDGVLLQIFQLYPNYLEQNRVKAPLSPLPGSARHDGRPAGSIRYMGILKAERTVEVNAPKSRCYEIISDLENSPEWQEAMVSAKVLETDSEGRPGIHMQNTNNSYLIND